MATTVPDVNNGDLLSASAWGDPVRIAITELQTAPPNHASRHQPGGADAIPTAAPGSSAPADTPAAGTSTSLSRADHRHGREAAGGSVSYGSPGASAVGDSAADGTATTVTRSDHRHSREAFGAPVASAPGDTTANGSATTVARADHRHGREAAYAGAGLVNTINFVIDGAGAAIATGIKGDLIVDYACTITKWTLLGDASGSIVVDIWKDSYANFPPVVGDKITASAPPTISGATKGQSSTLTGWTTAIAAGDVLRVNVNSAATMQRVTLALTVVRT